MLHNALIQALGGRCQYIDEDGIQCEETEELQAHHLVPYGQRSRPNSKEYFKPKGKELRCEKHHRDTGSWRGKKRTIFMTPELHF